MNSQRTLTDAPNRPAREIGAAIRMLEQRQPYTPQDDATATLLSRVARDGRDVHLRARVDVRRPDRRHDLGHRDPGWRAAVTEDASLFTERRPWGASKKTCTWCRLVQPVTEFARSPKGWLTSECRSCASERLACWERVDKHPVVLGRRYVDSSAATLICKRCGRDRPKDLFYTYEDGRSRRRYFRPNCKQCSQALLNATARKYRDSAKSKAKNRDRWLRKKYGIPLAEYGFYLFCQNGRCGICGTDQPGGPTPDAAFHVDHDHQTKRVRGLLCRACNTAIGLLKEDPALFAKAVTYLRQGGVFDPAFDEEDELALLDNGPACLHYEPKETS